MSAYSFVNAYYPWSFGFRSPLRCPKSADAQIPSRKVCNIYI